MFLFGHVGCSVAAVRAVDREVDLRAPALFSILPDLIDKPLALLFPHLVNENTRNFAHSLAGALAVLALLLAARRRVTRPWLLWACYAGHLLLDRMWLTSGPAILFWPFLGPFPARFPDSPRTPYLLLYNAAGEVFGLAVILALAWRYRLLERPRWDAFKKTGRLPPCTETALQ
jgi:membrane-bound metal-dependent hydrolase YbcI (DUF457 family)